MIYLLHILNLTFSFRLTPGLGFSNEPRSDDTKEERGGIILVFGKAPESKNAEWERR